MSGKDFNADNAKQHQLRLGSLNPCVYTELHVFYINMNVLTKALEINDTRLKSEMMPTGSHIIDF